MQLSLFTSDSKKEYLYRYSDYVMSRGYDECGDPIPGGVTNIRLEKYSILRYTKTGARLTNGRFVSFQTTKKFACRTVEEAKESFIKRKEKEISIYQNRIAHCKQAIFLIRTLSHV